MNMKINLVTIVSAAAFGMPSVGMAQSTMDSVTKALTGPESGWYLGGSIGQSSAKDACNRVAAPGVSCDDSDAAFRLFGGYQINKHFGVEVGYVDLGAAEASSGSQRATTESQAFDFVAVGTLPLAERFSVYGKLGVYFANVDASSNFPGTTGQSNQAHDLTYAVGAQFDFSRNLGIRAEWQRFQDVGGNTVGKSDVDMISVGAIWRFR